jgi:hypothetical protein
MNSRENDNLGTKVGFSPAIKAWFSPYELESIKLAWQAVNRFGDQPSAIALNNSSLYPNTLYFFGYI